MEGYVDRIIIDREILGGKPVIRGTRIPVYLIIELLGNGLTEKEVLMEYPTLCGEDIKAALLYASKCLENEETIILQKGLADLPRFIVDENVPSRVREWLTKKGFEITNVNQAHLKGAKDHVIGDFAAKNGLAIITLDNHFSQIYRTLAKDQLTIIIIKAKPATSANIIQILDLAQQKINLKEVKSKLLIVSKNKIRIIT